MGQLKGDNGSSGLLPPEGHAVWGDALNNDAVVGTSNQWAVRGTTTADSYAGGAGVLGICQVSGGVGVAGASTGGMAVMGTDATTGRGVHGDCISGTGVYGESKFGNGVQAVSENVALFATSKKTAVFAIGPTAGFFWGNVSVTGSLSKPGGGFRIDHPLDPERRYLNHSFVESPERKNLYDGTAVCDRQGEAVVALPDWFEPLNYELRYQLTPIGAPAPGLHVATEVEGGRFRIAGGAPGLKVSWQVTGTRQDAWAKAHPLAVEEDKDAEERGYFLHPEEHGHPVERSIHRKVHAEAQEHLNRPVTPLDPNAPRLGERTKEP